MTNEQEGILIVDDEELIRRLLYQRLSSEGYQCQGAGSVEQSLAKLRNNRVELMILDIKMPDAFLKTKNPLFVASISKRAIKLAGS